MAETEDIRKTGITGLRGLRGLNFQPQYDADNDIMNQVMSENLNKYLPKNDQGVGIAAAEAGYGSSQYDDAVTSETQFEDLNEVRYAEQPWYDTLANGVGKMLGTAGTTFVSSLVGLPYGVGAAINQGRWSALWDNSVTQGLADADKWLEENMTNYRSQIQQNSPWYSPDNLFSMNFIADDVIKNMGFTLGAAASMAVGSGSLGLMGKALGFVNDVSKGTKMGSAALSALFSATGEGMIEARQGVEERNKLEMQKLEDALMPEYNALEMQQQEANQRYRLTGDYNTYKLQMQDIAQQRQELDKRKSAGQQQITESGQEMGNTILLANQGLLTLGNLIQFGKGMVKGFDKARHAAETSSKAAKPFGVSASRVSNNIKDGYQITGKNFGRTIAATKGFLTEGSEEMNQQWAQSGAGAYYTEKDVNDYWKARLDPESYRETTKGLYTFGQALDRGFQESWGDVDQWEQFVIGGLTGLAGSYTPTKLFNQDKTKSRLNPWRYGSWEGGAIKEVKDFNKQYNQYEENIDDINKILQSEDFPARVRSMVGHTYTESEKTAAAEADDKKAYKDAEDKQFVHDIQAFLRAGKLDDLKAIYNDMSSNLSDDDIENIVKSTTREISVEEDKKNFDRVIDEQIAGHQRRIAELQDKAKSIGDSQDALGIEERASYQAAMTPVLEDIFSQIDAENDTINNLEQKKQSYVGQKYFEGAYVDRQRNRTATNDEIRETVKHNADELNRKLDSYLESIAVVNRDTKGVLSKDQEDNLAYLHHLGRESITRADKIIAKNRKDLPQKFLMKTDKTPEQLSREYASSDLAFNKDENTREGYVEVDTSMLDDRGFRNFFIGELLWGGNIDPEFGETAEEKAAREEEEKNLSEEERKRKAKERLSKKWQESLKKRQKDAEEQRDVNGDLIADNFIAKHKDDNISNAELQSALNGLFTEIVDASSLVSQAGEYDKTLREYMANPNKVDQDKAKEETKAQKDAEKQQVNNKFAGKDARQMKKELSEGVLDEDDFSNFADMDLSGDAPAPIVTAQQEAKKVQESRRKANSLKQHIQEQLGDNPTAEELNAAQIAMQMVSQADIAADNAEDLSIDMPELAHIPLDATEPDVSIDDVEDLNNDVQEMLARAFNAYVEDENAQDDIPETVPSDALDDVEPPTTGHDEAATVPPEVTAPVTSSPSVAAKEVIPKSPLTDGAIDSIINETANAMTSSSTSGTWRSTTTRHPYGKSTGTYHESLNDKNSKEYRRSKALWEYLNEEGAFDRQENASADRIKEKDTIHFMVKYLPEVYGKEYSELTEEEKPYALAIIMLNDNGEVLGDLPIAQLEPSFRRGNPSLEVKELLALQEKVFKAFDSTNPGITNKEAIVDGVLHKEGVANLNLTSDDNKKNPLTAKVKQVMRGVVPYSESEKNTLNEVVQGTPEIAVKVDSDKVAVKRGDRKSHNDIIIPKVGNLGQPYLLLPTASGEKVAVPFYMVAFDAEKHKNTALYNTLANSLFYMLSADGNSEENLKLFGKHMDILEGLLQVRKQTGAKRILRVDLRNREVSLHLESLADPNKKYNISIPYSDDYKAMVIALIDKLNGIPINVSLEYLNSNVEVGTGTGAWKVDYNHMIGEIADVNLPKATTHTVNSWFTVSLNAGKGSSKKVGPKTQSVVTENIGGRNIRMNLNNMTAVDTVTGEIIEDDEQVILRMAQIKAGNPTYKRKGFIQISLGDRTYTYDVKNNILTKEIQKPQSRKDFAKEISEARTLKELMDIQKAASEAKTKGLISEDDFTKLSEYIKIKGEEIFSDNPDIQDVSAPTSGAVSFAEAPGQKPETKTQPQPQKQALTIEQIESIAKKDKINGRKTQDAWEAIPDELKLKILNDHQPIILSYGNTTVTISLSDKNQFTKELEKANMAAKTGKLSVSEAVKPMEKNGAVIRKERERAARKWLARNLPTLSSEERTQFVEKMARAGDNAGRVWGSYRNGVLQIRRNAPMGTVYHEAFHYVMDMLLSPEEKKELLDIAMKEYGMDDSWAAEERLASDFRRYALDENAEGIVGRILRWIRRLRDKMMRYDRISDATVNQLFWKINNGELAEKAEFTENLDVVQQRVLREIRNIQQEKLAWNNLSRDTKAALLDSGLSEAVYQNMSLEEKQQYVRCRG